MYNTRPLLTATPTPRQSTATSYTRYVPQHDIMNHRIISPMTLQHPPMVECVLSFFFFSSRRRHTRLQGDWSSDVCSSDLYDFLSAVSDIPGRIAGIDDQRAVIDKPLIIDCAVIGGNKHQILRGQRFFRQIDRKSVV